MMGEGKRKLWAKAVTRIEFAFEQFCRANCRNHRHISVQSRPATANPFGVFRTLSGAFQRRNVTRTPFDGRPATKAFCGASGGFSPANFTPQKWMIMSAAPMMGAMPRFELPLKAFASSDL
jgi:hypothetical protein